LETLAPESNTEHGQPGGAVASGTTPQQGPVGRWLKRRRLIFLSTLPSGSSSCRRLVETEHSGRPVFSAAAAAGNVRTSSTSAAVQGLPAFGGLVPRRWFASPACGDAPPTAACPGYFQSAPR
jgi:hypothetical protein